MIIPLFFLSAYLLVHLFAGEQSHGVQSTFSWINQLYVNSWITDHTVDVSTIEYFNPVFNLHQMVVASIDAYISLFASHEVSPTASHEVITLSSYEVKEFRSYEKKENESDEKVLTYQRTTTFYNHTIYPSVLFDVGKAMPIDKSCMPPFIYYHSTSTPYEYPVIIQGTFQHISMSLQRCKPNLLEPHYSLTFLMQLLLGILNICIHMVDKFKFISLLYAEWSNSVWLWLLENLHNMLIFTRTTVNIIRRLCIFIKQSSMRCHDFAVLRPGFNKPTCIFDMFLTLVTSVVACPTVMGGLCDYIVAPINAHNTIISSKGISGQLIGIIPCPQLISLALKDIMKDINPKTRTKPKMIFKPERHVGGGGRSSSIFSGIELTSYADKDSGMKDEYRYRYVGHGTGSLLEYLKEYETVVVCRIPLICIVEKLTRSDLLSIAMQHGILINTKSSKSDMISAFLDVGTNLCSNCITAFRQVSTLKDYRNVHYKDHNPISKIKQVEKNSTQFQENKFPPPPSTMKSSEKIIKNFIDATSPNRVEESGCAVCGALSLKVTLMNLSGIPESVPVNPMAPSLKKKPNRGGCKDKDRVSLVRTISTNVYYTLTGAIQRPPSTEYPAAVSGSTRY